MMETKRCFIALDLPREVINEIKRIQRIIGKRNLFNGKFTEPENLHLTLKFLSSINNNKIKEIVNRLREIKFPEFDVELGDVGVFSKSFVRIIWVELLGAGELQKKIDEKLECLFDREDRFMSHITIARVKGVADKRALIEYLKSVKPSQLSFKVDKFFLKESELFPEGPVYKVIRGFELVDSKKEI